MVAVLHFKDQVVDSHLSATSSLRHFVTSSLRLSISPQLPDLCHLWMAGRAFNFHLPMYNFATPVHPVRLMDEQFWRAPNAFGARKSVQKKPAKPRFFAHKTQ